MNRLFPMAVLLALAGSLRAQDAPAPAGAQDLADGSVLRRARIPSEQNAQGETRLIHREQGACVQTLLHTTALRRGIHEMLKKEKAAWPAGAPGSADSLAYQAALEAAKDHVAAGAEARQAPDGRVSLLMEVSLTPTAAGYAFYDVRVTREADEFMVTDKRLIASATASRYYVSRAMHLMSAAAFRLPEEELTGLLRRAGWEPIAPAADGAPRPGGTEP